MEFNYSIFLLFGKISNMKKINTFFISLPLITLPIVAISCKENPQKKEPNDSEFSKIKDNFKKLTFKDTNVFKDTLKSDLNKLKEFDSTTFYRNFLYNDDVKKRLSLLNIRDDSDFWKGINKNEFEKKYKIVTLAIDNKDKVSLTFQFALLPKNSEYKYKGKTYLHYFYYLQRFYQLKGFKNFDKITEKRNKDKSIINYVSITIATLAIVGLIIYIIVRIIIKKKKGIKDVQVY